MLKGLVKFGLSVAALYALRKIYKAYKSGGTQGVRDFASNVVDDIKDSKFAKDFENSTSRFSADKEAMVKEFLDKIISKDYKAKDADYIEYVKTFKRAFSALSDVQNFPYSYNVNYLKRLRFNVNDIEKANAIFKRDLSELYDFISAHCEGFETLIARKSDFNTFNTQERILFENLYLAYGAVIGMMDHIENKQEYTESVSKQLRGMLKELQDRMTRE